MEKNEKDLLYKQQINRIINEISLRERVQLSKLKEKHARNGTIDSGAYPSDVINLKINLITDKIERELSIYKKIYLENGINTLEIKNDIKTLLENKQINLVRAFDYFIANDNSFQNHPKNIILQQFEQKLSRLISEFDSKNGIELIEGASKNKKPPLIELFEISPSRVSVGEAANLHWKIKNNITSIIIENEHKNGDKGKYTFGKKSEGQYLVNPKVEDEINYTLIAENEVGKDTRSVKLLIKRKETKPKPKTLLNKNKSKIKFFISHSEKNKKLVGHFVKEILLGNFANDDEFYCTSVSGMKNSPGDDWKKKLAKNLMDSKIFLAIVSEEYKKSEICQNELGAAWISNKKIIPLLVKPITYKKMGYLLNEKHAAKIDDSKDLDRLKDKFKNILKSKNIKSDKWTESKEEFLRKVTKIIKKRLDRK